MEHVLQLLLAWAAPNNLMTFLEQTVSQNIPEGHVIVFSLPSESWPSETIIANFHEKTKWPLLVSTDSQSIEKDIPEPQDAYVVFLFPDEDLVESLEIQVEALRTFSFSFNRRGKFFVVVLDEDLEDPQATSRNLLVTLWNMDNIVNAVTLVSRRRSAYQMYALFPFRPSKNCGKSEDVVRVGEWTPENGSESGAEAFPQKAPSDLKGCTLTIEAGYNPPFSWLHDTGNYRYEALGINSVCLKGASKGMNFSMDFLYYESAGEWFRRVTEMNVVSVLPFELTAQLCSIVDVSVPYFFESYDLLVPRARRNSVSGNFLQVFSSPVWALSALLLILAGVLFRFYESQSSCSRSLMEALAVCLSVSVDRLPQGTGFRAFFVLFVVHSFAMSTIFQSFFTSFLVEPGTEKQITTIQEVNDHQMELMVKRGIKEYESISGVQFTNQFRSVRSCEIPRQCVAYVHKHRNSTILDERHVVDLLQSQEGVGDEAKLFSAMTLVAPALVIPFKKGFPLQDRFNWHLRGCLESGLADKYYADLKRESVPLKTDEDSSYVVLGVVHLKVCFALFGLGSLLSVATFLFEHCFCFKRRKRL